MKKRLIYFLTTASIITTGIISRKIYWIPAFTGDVLYAVMMYFLLRMVFVRPLKLTAITALMICFAIEFSQLIRTEWMLAIRSTTIGRYTLGQGFLWSDLLAYTIGITVALFLDSLAKNKPDKVSNL